MKSIATKLIGVTTGSGAALLWAATALAQVSTTTTTTPGVPSTGAGGDYTTSLTVLAIAALALIVGVVYLARRSPSQVEDRM